MSFFKTLSGTVSLASSILGLLLTLFFFFGIWGVFNGFNWDLMTFATGIGKVVGGLLFAAWFIYGFVNRQKKEADPEGDKQKQKNSQDWSKL